MKERGRGCKVLVVSRAVGRMREKAFCPGRQGSVALPG